MNLTTYLSGEEQAEKDYEEYLDQLQVACIEFLSHAKELADEYKYDFDLKVVLEELRNA